MGLNLFHLLILTYYHEVVNYVFIYSANATGIENTKLAD